jgi:hypothetical protein
VACFGNVHLVYASLRREEFNQLIARDVQRIVDETRNRFDITLTVDATVHELIYRNGVFPVQGVRPLFSSVADVLETNLSKLVLRALMDKQTTVSLRYDVEAKALLAKVGTIDVVLPYTGRIDRIRQRNLQDAVANISVHEAGHAVAYAVLFGMAPLQITSKVASSYAGGFTFPHDIHETRDNMLKKMVVLLAGGLAEEQVFGVGQATTGRSHDRQQASQLAVEFIRNHGFHEAFQANYMVKGLHELSTDNTDATIESLINSRAQAARALLSKHHGLLLAIAKQLSERGVLHAAEVAALCTEHNVVAVVEPEGHLHIDRYRDFVN